MNRRAKIAEIYVIEGRRNSSGISAAKAAICRAVPGGTSMTTMYFVQGFRLKGRKIEPDVPQTAKTPEGAIAAAERMAPSRHGVWAYSADIDVETDSYDEPKVLFRGGNLPPGLGE
jgi:hypothetical protein